MRSFQMCLRPLTLCMLMVVVLSLTPSCVDDRYNLDNISAEITIGGEEVVVPLGELDSKTLDEMFGEMLQGLIDDDDDVYNMQFESEEETVTIDGVSMPVLTDIAPQLDYVTFSSPVLPSDFVFSKVETSFVLGYPDLNVVPSFNAVEFMSDIDTGFDLPMGGVIGSLGELSFSDSGKVPFKASFQIPQQIKSIGKIYFGESATDYGSPIELVVEFNGLKSINGGGKLNLQAAFPSNYTLKDENGASIGNVLSIKNYDVAAGVEQIEIKAYLHSIDFSKSGTTQGKIDINEEISYQFDYTFNSVEGYCNASVLPQFGFTIDPAFRDMEIVINDIVIDDANHVSEVNYTLNGIPESIQSIDYIAFESAPLKIKVSGLSWLQTDELAAELQLPEMFIFEPDIQGWLDTSTNRLVAPMRKLESGVTLHLKAIDCTKGDITMQSGQLVIATSIQSHISDLEEDLSFMLSEVLPPAGGVNVMTTIEEEHFYLDLAESVVTMREQYFDFKLEDSQLPRIEHTLELPKELVAIDRLEVCTPEGEKVKVRFGISHPTNEVFPVDKVYLSLSVNFRQLITPVAGQQYLEKAPNGDNILRLDHVEWRPNDDPSLDVFEIAIEAIENLPEIVADGDVNKIFINEKFAVTGGVSIDAGTDVNLEALSSRLNFDFEIDDAKVSKFYGKLDYTLHPDNLPQLELGDLAKSGLKIENLDIDPIIRFNISNPIAVPFNASLSLKPFDAGGSYMAANRVDINDVHINGEGETHLVISTKNRREEFAGVPDITFVEVDLGKLFIGSLPSKIAVDFTVSSDMSATHVIDLAKPSYQMSYDYSVNIPLEFGEDFDVYYEESLDNLQPIFEFMGGLPIVSVGEVAVLADFVTTIPLDFVLSTECYDANGNPTEAKVIFATENMIHGYHADEVEEGQKESHSTLVLKIDPGPEGDFSRLADIDQMRMRLNIRNTSHTPSALSGSQTIGGNFRLRIRDGVTVDLNELFDGGETEDDEE